MKVRFKLANRLVPFRVTNFDIDFEDRLGTFTIYADFSIDALNAITKKPILERLVDYPYVLKHTKLIYKLLDLNMSIWMNTAGSSTKGLFKYVMERFRKMYEKGSNPGGFEVLPNTKWKISSLSYSGIELDGEPSQYDTYFQNGIVKLKVFGEFALREV